MSKLATHFTDHELDMIYTVVRSRQHHLAQNNCYGDDYDELGSILKKIEVSKGTYKWTKIQRLRFFWVKL